MQAARKSQLESFDVSAAEFLRLYPKPEEVFYRTDVHLGQLYKRHSLIGLMNDFRKINMNEIKNTLNAFNDRYAPAYRLLVHVSQQIGQTWRHILFLVDEQHPAHGPLSRLKFQMLLAVN